YEGWRTFVSLDVVHAIDARYRTIAARNGRAIGGLSEGGYGALNIAMHSPQEFSLVESWSGYERAARNHSIFGRQPPAPPTNPPLDRLRLAAATFRRQKTFFWVYS